MPIVIDVEQGSDSWLAARRGLSTASRMVDVMSYLQRGGESQRRADYRWDLVAARMTGKTESTFVSAEMQWGIDQEKHARVAYELANDVLVEQVGFVVHSDMEYTGGSPDGWIANDGVLEIKSPKSTTHLQWMYAGVIPEKHEPQCMWNIAVGEREWCDFVSFDPRQIDSKARMFTVRLYRDEGRIKKMTEEVEKFEAEIVRVMEQLKIGNTLNSQLLKSVA